MIDSFITAAICKNSYKPVMVRSYREDGLPIATIKKLHEIHHDNLLILHESFSFKGYCHLILKRKSISLVKVVACPHYPTIYKLVAIVRQVSLMYAIQDKILTLLDRD